MLPMHSLFYREQNDRARLSAPPVPQPAAVDTGATAFAHRGRKWRSRGVGRGIEGVPNPLTKLYPKYGNGDFTKIVGTPFMGVDRGSIAFADIGVPGPLGFGCAMPC